MSWLRRRRTDALGAGFILLLVLLYVSPALRRGTSFGPFDLLSSVSALTAGLVQGDLHNNINGDVVAEGAAWHTLNWRLIHQGQFPLWNDYSVLGMPHFVNFEASVLSLPSLVSYLAPLRQSMLVAVSMKLAIAGLGVYAFMRLLGIGVIGAAFAGATYMLSGAFANWIGWPLGDVMAWFGWIATGLLLCHRRPRPRSAALLAVSIAFAVYGGFPEADVLLLLGLGVIFGLWALLAWRRVHLAGAAAAVAGSAAGLALSAPLWLPGQALVRGSVRATSTVYYGLPAKAIPLLLAQGYYGLPTTPGNRFFGPVNYYETAAYVGVIACFLAAIAVIRWWSRPQVVALVVAALLPIVLTYNTAWFQVVVHLVNALHLGAFALTRSRLILSFAVAVLAGLGVEVLLASRADPRARRACLWGAAAVVVLVLVVDVRGLAEHLPAQFLSDRRRSLLWPTALAAAVALAGAAVLFSRSLPRRLEQGLALALLAGQGAFLVAAGRGIDTYSHLFFPDSAETAVIQRTVGTDLMALDGSNTGNVREWQGVGFYPNVNVGYGVREFTGYDPLLPKEYFLEWPGPAFKRLGAPSLFTPAVDSADLARQFGISYLLAAGGRPAPPGAEAVATVNGETLYRVPDVQRFTVQGGSVSRVANPANGTWTFHVETSADAKLVMRVTYVAGWHLSVDGHEVPVRRDQGFLVAATVPSGSHEVKLWYWPRELTIGIVLAAAALAGLTGWAASGFLAESRRRTRGSRLQPPAETDP